MLKLLSAAPRATFTPLSCSPNFQRVPYLDIRTLTHEQIVNYVLVRSHFTLKVNMNLSEDKFSRILRDSMKSLRDRGVLRQKTKKSLLLIGLLLLGT